MSKIHVLPQDIVNKIAAGEVVERPASVVKELLENSIDANSNNIKIDIEEGGIKKIAITDNGTGLSLEDLKMCILPHATSKLNTEDDLLSIKSYGFRGEALASIVAVSKTTITTRTKDHHIGYELKIDGGYMVSLSEVGCPVGTAIVVEDLFYNVPARREFIKSEATEFKAIVDIVNNIALAYPNTGLNFNHNSKNIYTLPKDHQLEDRVRQVFGTDFFDKLIPVFYEHPHIEIYGFVTKPEMASSKRKEQLIFVNKRSITDKSVAFAVKEAFGSLIAAGTYPGYILFIDVPANIVDVNVHPRKEEVRFSNSQLVFTSIKTAVKKTLELNVLTPGAPKPGMGIPGMPAGMGMPPGMGAMPGFGGMPMGMPQGLGGLPGMPPGSMPQMPMGMPPGMMPRPMMPGIPVGVPQMPGLQGLPGMGIPPGMGGAPGAMPQLSPAMAQYLQNMLGRPPMPGLGNMPMNPINTHNNGPIGQAQNPFGKPNDGGPIVTDAKLEDPIKDNKENDANKSTLSGNVSLKDDQKADEKKPDGSQNLADGLIGAPQSPRSAIPNMPGSAPSGLGTPFPPNMPLPTGSMPGLGTGGMSPGMPSSIGAMPYGMPIYRPMMGYPGMPGMGGLPGMPIGVPGMMPQMQGMPPGLGGMPMGMPIGAMPNIPGMPGMGQSPGTLPQTMPFWNDPNKIGQTGRSNAVNSSIFAAHKLYLIKESTNGITIYDQHAVHERILYEKVKKEHEDKKQTGDTQRLLAPIIINISVQEEHTLNQFLNEINGLGFEIEEFGPNTYKILKVPNILAKLDIKNLIHEILEDLEHDGEIKSVDSKSDKILTYVACRSAYKAGDSITEQEANEMIKKLDSGENTYTCPHGRPVKIEITLAELAKMFKRTGFE